MTRIPRWAAWLDVIALALLAVAAKAAISDALRFSFLGQPVTVADPWRPFLAAGVLLAVRHWRVPQPSVWGRVRGAARHIRHEPYANVTSIWAVSRAGVLLAGAIAVLTIGRPEGATQRISDDPFEDLPSRWDVAWYTGIAREGYSYDPRLGESTQQTVAFFPAYPALLYVASVFTEPERLPLMTYERYLQIRDARLAWAGAGLSIVLFFAALALTYRWTEMKAGAEAALATVTLLAAYPFALFYSAPYTESLFLVAIVGACYAFERERWGLAAMAGLLAGLTRPNGAMLSLTLGLLALAPLVTRGAPRPAWHTARRVVVAAMPGIGMLLHAAYIRSLTGDAFAWVKVQQAWGRSFASTTDHLDWAMRTLLNEGPAVYLREAPIAFVQTLACLFALAMVWPVFRRFGVAYAVLVLATVLPPLFKGGVLSMGRLTSTLFPVFAALAIAVPARHRGAWILLFALGQGLMAALFFTWRPVF